MSRPSKFSQQIADEICGRIIAGESLRSVCNDETMPARSSVFKWLGDNKEFADQYARAREMQADALFDEILDIADDTKRDDESNPQHIQRARLRVDARKWMASKLLPKKYGDKLELAGDPKAPLRYEFNVGGE